MNRQDYILIRSIGGPSLQALVLALREYRDELKQYDPEELTEYGEEEPYGDVRLQVYPGSDSRTRPEYPFWSLNTGDAQYDHDHRGYWGAASVGPDDTIRDLRQVAQDLMDQVLEQHCEDQEVPSHVR